MKKRKFSRSELVSVRTRQHRNLISAGVAFPMTDDDNVSRLLDDINTSPDSDWFRSKNPVLPA